MNKNDLTIQEAIRHIEDVLKSSVCENCKKDHAQLKQWLLELIELRKIVEKKVVTKCNQL